MSKLWKQSKFARGLHLAVLSTAVILLMGAGDDAARFNDLGHRMMCVCGCSQILLECNHVGCSYSDRMRSELSAGIEKGDNDDLILQTFVQKYGTVVIAAPATKGFGRVAWVMPFLVLIMGVIATVLLVRAWRNRPAALPSGVAPVTGTELDAFRNQARQDTEL